MRARSKRLTVGCAGGFAGTTASDEPPAFTALAIVLSALAAYR